MAHHFTHRFSKQDTPFALGRHIDHDSRSRDFVFQIPARVTEVSVLWPHNTPVLDQGQVGSCTGNAMAQLLNCRLFASCRGNKLSLTEADALKLYSLATHLDGFGPQQYYPPNDDGSSGLGVAKAAVQLGYVDTYLHAFTFQQVKAAIQTQPLITGTSWTNPMFHPDPATGFITVGPLNDQTVVGGHEYLIQGIDYEKEAVIMLNSWGTGWGGYAGLKPGQARISFSDYQSLLSDSGDVVVPHGKGLPPNE